MSAEELSVHADLFARDGGFTPRPAWQVIEAARRQMLTGELSLATTPKTHVYLRDGHVYFAERTTDGGLGVRLLVEGVITRQQMGKGALLVSGVEHLGRMFQRDPSIDRQPVELCVELMTDEVLTSVANDVVDHYTMTMYKRHPNGIDRWLPNRIEIITHIVEGAHLAEPDSVITAGPGPRTRTTLVEPPAAVRVAVDVAVEAALEEAIVEQVAHEQVVAAVLVVDESVVQESVVDQAPVEEVVVEEVVAHEAVVEEVVVEEFVADQASAEEVVVEEVADIETLAAQAAADHAITEELAVVESNSADDITAALALATTYSDNGSSVSLAQSAVDAMMSTTIADEVAEAVRRALSAIDAAVMPMPNFSPSDFADPVPVAHDTASSVA